MTSTVRPKTLLECDALAKVFTRNFELGRRHVFSDIFRLRARSLDRLRPEEWVAVRGFSITIHEGENVLVLGMAGSGKTTIAKLLTGMLRADGGRVCLGGRVGLIGGRAVGMVAFLTVWECVQLATGIHGVEPEVADACCEEVLEITGLSGERDTRLIDLPKERGGQLGLVSALVVPKDLRIFDGLPRVGDDPVSRRVAARVGQVLDQGANLILSSTTAGLPDNLSRAMILHDGEILYEGSPQMVVPVYDKFIYRINRLDHMQSQPMEAGSVTPDVREALTPGEVIRRSVRS
ncbi:MAG: ATP-binding cassette domain-containing protein, partial [Acidobacteriota bacterium]|nr:ATP-binding cassette domain-containing protein [Acidobacteriota bacterium]